VSKLSASLLTANEPVCVKASLSGLLPLAKFASSTVSVSAVPIVGISSIIATVKSFALLLCNEVLHPYYSLHLHYHDQ